MLPQECLPLSPTLLDIHFSLLSQTSASPILMHRENPTFHFHQVKKRPTEGTHTPPTPGPHLLPSCYRNELLLLLPTWSLHSTFSHLLTLLQRLSLLLNHHFFSLDHSTNGECFFSHLEILLSWLHLPYQVQPRFLCLNFAAKCYGRGDLGTSSFLFLLSSFEPTLSGIGPEHHHTCWCSQ